jgi:hypothetical protein
MDLISSEMDSDFNAVGLKNQRRNLRQLPQVGGSNKPIDASRKALLAGKRISKNGKTYWETRRNRSDQKGTTV